MPKKKALSKGRLWIDIIQSSFLIMVFVNIVAFFCPEFKLTGAGFWSFIFRYLMILFLMGFSLRKIDWRKKYFNKYTTGLYIVFLYSVMNISFHYLLHGRIWWPIGVIDVGFVFLGAYLTKIKHNMKLIDLILLDN